MPSIALTRPGAAAWLLGWCLLALGPALRAQADPYQPLLQRARSLLVVSAAQAVDSDVAAEIEVRSQQAQAWWRTLDNTPQRSALWPDLVGSSRSAANTSSFNRLRALALAYAQPGSVLYGDASLGATLAASLDWLVAQHYQPNTPFSGNWWDWEIGSPQALNDCMVLLYDELGASRRANYIAAIDRWVPDATRRTAQPGLVETGANRLDKALVLVLRGALGGDAAKLRAGHDAITQVFAYVQSGDGFYRDGSFVQHGKVPYTASYGAVLIDSLSRILLILGDSPWAVTDPVAGVVDEWIAKAFLPILVRGAALDNLRGRAISREEDEGRAGRGILRDLLRLTARSTPANAALFRPQIKAHVLADTRRASYYAGLDPVAIAEFKALVADASVPAQAAAPATWVYASMDRAVHHRPGFSYAVAMFSPRTAAFEYGNGENPQGWLTGAGMGSLLMADPSQYIDGYWPTVDMARLPGVTTDGVLPVRASGFATIGNPRHWVGGAALPHAGAVLGMEFSLTPLTGSTLAGRKSWFLLGDVIVALGSDIQSTGAQEVETIVDNRKLSTLANAGQEALLLNGVYMPNRLGWQSLRNDVRTAHLSGHLAGDGIGYYFPKPAPLRVWRETRQGAWSDMNPAGSTTLLRRNYVGLALGHGCAPAAGTYAYMVLPGASPAQLKAFAAAPSVHVLADRSAVHAVRDRASGLLAANFWVDAPTTVAQHGQPLLRADRRAAVLLRESESTLELAIAEPSQTATGTLTLEWLRPVGTVRAQDPAITVLSTRPTLKLAVALAGLQGRSLQLRVNALGKDCAKGLC